MPATLLPADGYGRAPWRNGRGVSREVSRGEIGGRATWLVSLTTIESDCPFSDYRGYDRVFTPLGEGVTLVVGESPPEALPRFRPFAFSGDSPVECRLAAGPAEVINAMVARDWGTQSVTMLQATPARFAVSAPIAVLHAPGGASVIVAGAAPFRLGAGDSLRLDDMAEVQLIITDAGAAPIYLASFRPRA